MGRCNTWDDIPGILAKRTVPRGDCLEWTGNTGGTGYGVVKLEGKRRPVHHLACELAHGITPYETAQVAWTCKNKLCVKPEHLKWAPTGVALAPLHPLEPLLARKGACVGQPLTSAFFATKDEDGGQGAIAQAKSVCLSCSVFDECRTVVDHVESGSMNDRNYAGVWAAETPGERVARRKDAKRRQAA